MSFAHSAILILLETEVLEDTLRQYIWHTAPQLLVVPLGWKMKTQGVSLSPLFVWLQTFSSFLLGNLAVFLLNTNFKVHPRAGCQKAKRGLYGTFKSVCWWWVQGNQTLEKIPVDVPCFHENPLGASGNDWIYSSRCAIWGGQTGAIAILQDLLKPNGGPSGPAKPSLTYF